VKRVSDCPLKSITSRHYSLTLVCANSTHSACSKDERRANRVTEDVKMFSVVKELPLLCNARVTMTECRYNSLRICHASSSKR